MGVFTINAVPGKHPNFPCVIVNMAVTFILFANFCSPTKRDHEILVHVSRLQMKQLSSSLASSQPNNSIVNCIPRKWKDIQAPT